MPTQGKSLRTTVPDEETRRRVDSYATLKFGGISEMIRALIEAEMHAHEKTVLEKAYGRVGQIKPINLSMSVRGGYRQRRSKPKGEGGANE